MLVGPSSLRDACASHALERPAAADRIHQWRDSVVGNEPAALEELFDCGCVYRRLGRAVSRRKSARSGHDRGMGRRGQAAPAVCTENLIRVDDVMESHKLAE